MKEQLIPFEIKHTDSLGQGVSHHNDQVSFIPKTLPGETGEAEVYKKSKKVQFAKMTKLSVSSPARITPECVHFDQCTGCSFLHTNYENEWSLKELAANHQLKRLGADIPKKAFPAPERLNYRSRIQLHYDKRSQSLGLVNNISNKILEIPQCRIAHPKIEKKLQELYEDKNWLKLVKGQNWQGHLELQLNNDEVNVIVNQKYASGGFTQVNDAMNIKLNSNLAKLLDSEQPRTAMDLFGGNGNLTAGFNNFQTWVVDQYQSPPSKSETQQFISQNLYEEEAIKSLSTQLPKDIDLLILDPPRSGLKNIKELCDLFKFKEIVYISCFYPNMIRDLLTIEDDYQLKTIELYDFFPGTYHLEVLTYLERK